MTVTVRNVNRGQIPSPVGYEADRAAEVERRLSILESPDAGVLNRTVKQLQETVAKLRETVDFLATQSATAVNGGLFSYIGTATSFVYSATYDCSVTVTSSSTGKLLVTVGGTLTGSNLGKAAILGFEASWAGGSIAFVNDLYSDATVDGPATTVARTYAITVPPNTVVTIRTRRGASTSSNQQIIIAAQSLTVTKVGQ